MGRDYWGQFLKDSEKVVRDTNDIIRKNYETIVENFGDETRRMIKRIDCLNKLIDMELQLKTESTESSIPDEKKKQFLEIMETVHRIVDSLQNINALCNPLIGEQPHVNPGAHESDISRLETDRENLRNQIICFRQTVVGSENVFAPQLVLIPYSALVLPAGFGLVFLLLINKWDQKFVQPGLCLIATHGLLSTLTTLLVHKPYRLFFFTLCRRFIFLPAGLKVHTIDELTTLPNVRKLGTQIHITKF
ncbi:hypothetical protein GCK72_018302 [Caenorhabditis remanei]|uniref:Uncharacterized protein n=1 Tax=Caenorhabditis remanei TaxID=31234 RepID=A0A6A5G9E9_CAERE|nr:hypothetical protein GCK72_018302 [Caenorhabditis remanei]KAF1751748.1 hypothetical protein GCK72_018302 [Caenorhabditis remanei]